MREGSIYRASQLPCAFDDVSGFVRDYFQFDSVVAADPAAFTTTRFVSQRRARLDLAA